MISELIDKQALIADYRICGGCSEFENCNGYVTMCDSARIRQAINEAPTIESEPVRHGRWVYDETIGGMKHYYCTSCKERDTGNECVADENQILWFAFCPKCGAQMDGGADNG